MQCSERRASAASLTFIVSYMKLNTTEAWTLFGLLAVSFVTYYWIHYRQRAASQSDSYVRRESSQPIDQQHSRPTFAELSGVDKARLDAQRAVVLSAAKQRYGTSELRHDKNDLALLQRMLDDKVFSPSQTYELQSLGVVFGDVLASQLGLRWVMVTDEYGTDPTLLIPDTTANFNALTMISKRVERGETVEVSALYRTIEQDVPRVRETFKKGGGS
jgi:hypothetical protein